MAEAIFDGINGDWDDANNWSGGGGTSGKPTDTDDVTIRSAVQDIDTNTAAFAAISVVNFRVNPQIKVKVGTLAAPIDFNAITTLYYGGSGEFMSLDATTTSVYAQGSPSSTLYLTGDTYTNVYAISGKVDISTTAVVTNLYNSGASIIAKSNGTAFTIVSNMGGTLVSERSAATVTVDDGSVTFRGSAAVTTSATIDPGAKCYWLSSGTITLAEIKRLGVLSVVHPILGANQYNFTVTNHTRWTGATVVLAAPGISVTLSNAAVDRGAFLGNGVL